MRPSLVITISCLFPAFWRDIEGIEGKWGPAGFYCRRNCKGYSCHLLSPLSEEIMDPISLAALADFRRDSLSLDIRSPLLGAGKAERQQEREVQKGKGNGEGRAFYFLSQDLHHQEAAGPWASGKDSVVWTVCPRLWPCQIFPMSWPHL